MSPALIISAFAVCIIVMIIMISKWKIHPVTSILLISIVLAIIIGTPFEKIEGIINNGVAGTLKSIAIVILLGCFMGKVLEETGAAVKIAKWTINLFGPKRVIWAIAVASLILGIPIWADTVVIILISIVSNLAHEGKKSMIAYGSTLYIGALVTASLVPPTPGPVAAAALLKVPLGSAILWGLVVSIFSVLAATFYFSRIKEPLEPKPEFIQSASKLDDKDLPSISKAMGPIVLPLILIFANTILGVVMPNTLVSNIFKFIGSPLGALLAGCFYAVALTGKEWLSKKVQNDWVEDALKSSAMPIMVTAMGGALAAFIKDAGVAEIVAKGVASSPFPGFLIPILIAALIHVVTGSNALAVLTAAALVEPMLGTIGVTPLAAFLYCGTGALLFKHANSSGFWVTVSMSNMNIKQGIKGVSVGSTIAGITGCVITAILSYLGLV